MEMLCFLSLFYNLPFRSRPTLSAGPIAPTVGQNPGQTTQAPRLLSGTVHKYSDVTSEQAIRGTYCDLAVKHKGAIKFLIEVKAIGLTLKENHLRQAVGYGANKGIPWIVLTNGICWEVYRINFDQPISHESVCQIDMTTLSSRKRSDHELLYLLCKEGL
ncbi:MAG: type I restriction enzyme HsdR N-terminal domain-containing protein, partial [Candidatus Krumholzibacteriia bacterium]